MSKLSNSRPARLIMLAATVLATSMIVPIAVQVSALSSTPEMVKDIGTGSNGSDDLVISLGGLSDIFVDGDVAYFAARSSDGSGDGLWKSDGTAAGTTEIATATQLGGSGIDNFMKVGSNIYFNVIDIGGLGTLLKKYDGTTVTTAVTRENVRNLIGSGNAADYVIRAEYLWSAGGSVYFIATVNPSTPTWDLFRYNGTSLSRATTLNSGDYQGLGPVFELNGTAYFVACYDCNGNYSYEFDTIPTSGRVSAVIGGVKYSPSGEVKVVDGTPARAYVHASAPSGGSAIITFDGTTASVVTDGTAPIRYASIPTVVGSRVYFSGSDNTAQGNEALWFIDPATSATAAVEIASTRTFSISGYQTPGMHGSLNDSVYLFYQNFASNNYKQELWRTDGTDAGTFMLSDTGISSNYIGYLYAGQGEIYFNTAGGLRKSDGSESGTSAPFASPTSARRFTQGTNTLYFYAQTWVAGAPLGIELHAVGVAPPPSDNNSGNNSSNQNGSNTSGGGTTSGGNTSSSSTTSGLPSATELSGFKTVELVPSGSVNAGQSFDVSASGFQASEDVNAYLQGSSTSIGVSKASANGTATVSVKIPKNVSGKKTLYLFGKSSRHGVKQSITVQGTLTELPATGAQPLLLLWIAAAVMFGGVGLRRLGFTIRSRPTNGS